MDSNADNFNTNATYDDGTCVYPGLTLDPVSTNLCVDAPVLISWNGGNPNGLISISLINVTTNTTAFQIDITDNTGTYLWDIEDASLDVGNTYRFYIQNYPSPTNSWSYGNEFVFNSICTQLGTQTILFEQGWSMISTYIIPENTDFEDFVSDINGSIIIAKDYSGAAYLPEWSFNGIGNLVQGQGYQVKMSQSEILFVEGEQIQPENNPIVLNSGWNLIAYLRMQPQNVVSILSDIVADNNLIIAKDYIGNAYLPEWGFNGIGEMLPGLAYQIKVNSTDELIYLANE